MVVNEIISTLNYTDDSGYQHKSESSSWQSYHILIKGSIQKDVRKNHICNSAENTKDELVLNLRDNLSNRQFCVIDERLIL